jgi:hypothetical protein
MSAPDPQALRRGESDAWDETFRWLWSVVFAAGRGKLELLLPADVEEVASAKSPCSSKAVR